MEVEITGHVDWTAVGGELLQCNRQLHALSTAPQPGRLMTTKTRVELANVKVAPSSLNTQEGEEKLAKKSINFKMPTLLKNLTQIANLVPVFGLCVQTLL